MITVHMIGNAHLDPVWFWRWPTGVVEVLSTCRTAVELLDDYPEFVFTRSDVWVYELLEQLDPDLFQQISAYAAEGRWHAEGGWYIQPDCNLPLAESFRRHMEIGREHHLKHFGRQATVGYNVDSFGHAATLPSLLQEYGYDSYVMMRPGPHEKTLPGNLFRWRSPDGAEVIAWRIHDRYNATTPEILEAHIRSLLHNCVTPHVDHVMCFFGVGDHGGGPTRTDIEWILENRTAFPGCELVFSSPRRFFDAVSPFRDLLPVVEDELQMHAVGCYSVVREIKLNTRRTEHLALIGQRIVEDFPESAPANASRIIATAWRQTLFNQFHDVFDGTCVPDAYVDARDQLGEAASTLTTLTYNTLFRELKRLPQDDAQRVVLYNPTDLQFDGYFTYEPWLDWRQFQGTLLAPDGVSVPYQIIQQDSLSGPKRRLLWHAQLPARELTVYRLQPAAPPQPVGPGDLRSAFDSIENSRWVVRSNAGSSLLDIETVRKTGSVADRMCIDIATFDDFTDTWSHDVTGYSYEPRETFRAVRTQIEETGPLRARIRVDAEGGDSRLSLWANLYTQSSLLELELSLCWVERLSISKLIISLAHSVPSRSDAVPGGRLQRAQNGQEYPIVDWTLVGRTTEDALGIVSPDTFAVDGMDNLVRLTLARAPAFAWQGRKGAVDRDTYHQWTDQGEHRYRVLLQPQCSVARADALALHTHEKPLALDWTAGMSAQRLPSPNVQKPAG